MTELATATRMVDSLIAERDRLREVSAELLKALEYAAEWIADAQHGGCPAGVVAVPSRINDAIAKATADDTEE